jgi:hypothetical protein
MGFVLTLTCIGVALLIAALWGVAGRTAIASLISPGIYFLMITWPRCHALGGSCLTDFVIAPLILVLGPIAHEEREPPSPYPGIFLIAVAIVLIWTVIELAVVHRRQQRGG